MCNAGAALVHLLAMHPGLQDLVDQFRNERGAAGFQTQTDLSNHVTEAQRRACWPPFAGRPPPFSLPVLQSRTAGTHLGTRRGPMPSFPPPNPIPVPVVPPQSRPTGIHLGKRATPTPSPPSTTPALQSRPAGTHFGKGVHCPSPPPTGKTGPALSPLKGIAQQTMQPTPPLTDKGPSKRQKTDHPAGNAGPAPPSWPAAAAAAAGLNDMPAASAEVCSIRSHVLLTFPPSLRARSSPPASVAPVPQFQKALWSPVES